MNRQKVAKGISSGTGRESRAVTARTKNDDLDPPQARRRAASLRD